MGCDNIEFFLKLPLAGLLLSEVDVNFEYLMYIQCAFEYSKKTKISNALKADVYTLPYLWWKIITSKQGCLLCKMEQLNWLTSSKKSPAVDRNVYFSLFLLFKRWI